MGKFQCDRCGNFFSYDEQQPYIRYTYGDGEDNWEFDEDIYNPYDDEEYICEECYLDELF